MAQPEIQKTVVELPNFSRKQQQQQQQQWAKPKEKQPPPVTPQRNSKLKCQFMFLCGRYVVVGWLSYNHRLAAQCLTRGACLPVRLGLSKPALISTILKVTGS